MSWLRLYTELINDPKVMQLECKLFRTWIGCLCLAKRNSGVLPELADIAFSLRLKEETASQHVELLKEAGLIDVTSDGLAPHNWDQRQYQSDTSKSRTKRYRDRRKNVTVTSQHSHGDALRVQSTEYRVQSTESVTVTPTKFDPAYWVERLTELHPTPAEPRFVVTFCEDNLHRLSCDPHRYSAFMQVVEDGLATWCGYWASQGNQFVTGLEKWLAGGGWKKLPPATVTPTVNGKPRNRFVAPEEH